MLSVVIPTLNEAESLPQLIPRLRDRAGATPVEVIVSDCDSPDGTADVASRLADHVVRGGRTRGAALNRGVAVATGNALFFLHADSLPPPGYAQRILHILARPGFVGGAFDFQFSPAVTSHALDATKLSLVRFCNRFRFRYTRNYYGDQGVFVRADLFRRLGGFPCCALLEDIRFSRAMNRLGRTAILNPPILTSPRRFLARGVLTQLAQDMLLLGCDAFSIEPTSLWQRYNGLNQEGNGAKGEL